MNFGGPVWHASARATDQAVAWALAELALRGVGDTELGEWRERGSPGSGVVHLRRRLSDEERASVGGMVVRDIRGKPEERRRFATLKREAPHLAPYLP